MHQEASSKTDSSVPLGIKNVCMIISGAGLNFVGKGYDRENSISVACRKSIKCIKVAGLLFLILKEIK